LSALIANEHRSHSQRAGTTKLANGVDKITNPLGDIGQFAGSLQQGPRQSLRPFLIAGADENLHLNDYGIWIDARHHEIGCAAQHPNDTAGLAYFDSLYLRQIDEDKAAPRRAVDGNRHVTPQAFRGQRCKEIEISDGNPRSGKKRHAKSLCNCLGFFEESIATGHLPSQKIIGQPDACERYLSRDNAAEIQNDLATWMMRIK
jgi:hypothetical protein